MESQTRQRCSICAKPMYGRHNDNSSEPINSGRCCQECNMTTVIPARLGVTLKDEYKESLNKGIMTIMGKK